MPSRYLYVLPLSLIASTTAQANYIAANFDPETVDVDAMSYIRPNNTYFVGAHEDSRGAPGMKPIWTTTVFFTPDDDDTMGRVSIAVRARQQRDVRLELLDTTGVAINQAGIFAPPASNFTFMSKSVIPAEDIESGHTILDFDFDPIALTAGTTYALKLMMDSVAGIWTAGSFDWLGAEGAQEFFLLDQGHQVPELSEVADGVYGQPAFGVYSSGTLGAGLFTPGPSYAVQTPVPTPASLPVWIAISGLAGLRRRR